MAGDNGKMEGQKPEDAQPATPVPDEQIEVMRIFINKTTRQVSVNGLLGEKTLCLNVLSEALKVVANFQPSPIIVPGKKPAHNIMNFMRGRR